MSSYASVRRLLPVVRVVELVCPSPLLKPVVFLARQHLRHLLVLMYWQYISHLQHEYNPTVHYRLSVQPNGLTATAT